MDFCVACCSLAQSCLTLCDPMDCSTPGFPHHLPELAQLMSIVSVMPSNHLILSHLLLLLPSIVPTIRVFSNELVLYTVLDNFPKVIYATYNITSI